MSAVIKSSQAELDSALAKLVSRKDEWISVSVAERIAILDKLIHRLATLAPRLVNISLESKGFTKAAISAAEEWISGPYTIIRTLRRLEQALGQIESNGKPKIPGPVSIRANGQVIVRVFPQDIYDRIFFNGITADVWMQPGVKIRNLPETQASSYFKPVRGKVALVLGAGNVTGLAPTDAIHSLFVENQVVILKMSPVNAYVGYIIEEMFRPIVERGFLRVVYGGIEEGVYLCNHEYVDKIHVTGSAETYNSILFGNGEERIKRKTDCTPLITKPVTAELGGVAPIIIVPGKWTETDLEYQAELIATCMTDNAGFACSVPRVIIQYADWDKREMLLDQLRRILSHELPRSAFYPGSQSLFDTFMKAHPDAERFGNPSNMQLPWTLVAGLDPENKDDICFKMEAFFGFISETGLKAADTVGFIDKAVDFANNHLMGTLDTVILVSPESLKDTEVVSALDRAVEKLQYGTVAFNYHPAASWASGVTPWGPFPNVNKYDIQSGDGFVHNAMMFDQVQKVVFRAPFRCRPKPAWFLSRGRSAEEVFKSLFYFEEAPSPLKIPSILWKAIR